MVMQQGCLDVGIKLELIEEHYTVQGHIGPKKCFNATVKINDVVVNTFNSTWQANGLEQAKGLVEKLEVALNTECHKTVVHR